MPLESCNLRNFYEDPVTRAIVELGRLSDFETVTLLGRGIPSAIVVAPLPRKAEIALYVNSTPQMQPKATNHFQKSGAWKRRRRK